MRARVELTQSDPSDASASHSPAVPRRFGLSQGGEGRDRGRGLASPVAAAFRLRRLPKPRSEGPAVPDPCPGASTPSTPRLSGTSASCARSVPGRPSKPFAARALRQRPAPLRVPSAAPPGVWACPVAQTGTPTVTEVPGPGYPGKDRRRSGGEAARRGQVDPDPCRRPRPVGASGGRGKARVRSPEAAGGSGTRDNLVEGGPEADGESAVLPGPRGRGGVWRRTPRSRAARPG